MLNNLISRISAFHIFDITFIIIISISLLFGVFRGFIKSSLSMAGWILSFYLAVRFSNIFTNFFLKYTPTHSIAEIASITSLFIVFAIIIAIINGIINLFISPITGGLLDRVLGLFFGSIRGIFIISFSFYLCTIIWPALNVKSKKEVFNDNQRLPKWAKNSETLFLAARGAKIIEYYMPKSLKREAIDAFENIVREPDAISNVTIQPHYLLKILPKGFLSRLSNDHIAALQDTYLDYNKKIEALNSILQAYKSYIDDNHIVSQDKNDMTAEIEKEILAYKSLKNAHE